MMQPDFDDHEAFISPAKRQKMYISNSPISPFDDFMQDPPDVRTIPDAVDLEVPFTIKWNDPRLNIDWPNKNPILQERDK